MPHLHSATARAARRLRAAQRGFIVAKKPDTSFGAVEQGHVAKVNAIATSLALHREHQDICRKKHNFARQTTLASRDDIGDMHDVNVQKQDTAPHSRSWVDIVDEDLQKGADLCIEDPIFVNDPWASSSSPCVTSSVKLPRQLLSADACEFVPPSSMSAVLEAQQNIIEMLKSEIGYLRSLAQVSEHHAAASGAATKQPDPALSASVLAQVAAQNHAIKELANSLPGAVDASVSKRMPEIDLSERFFALEVFVKESSTMLAAEMENELGRIDLRIRDFNDRVSKAMVAILTKQTQQDDDIEELRSAQRISPGAALSGGDCASLREMTCAEFLVAAQAVRSRLPCITESEPPRLMLKDASPEFRCLAEESLFGPDSDDDCFQRCSFAHSSGMSPGCASIAWLP